MLDLLQRGHLPKNLWSYPSSTIYPASNLKIGGAIMADEGFKHIFNANLSADIEGYGRLMDDEEEATVRTFS